jgi:hypothetical protein
MIILVYTHVFENGLSSPWTRLWGCDAEGNEKSDSVFRFSIVEDTFVGIAFEVWGLG